MDELTRAFQQAEGLFFPHDRRRLWLGVAVAVLGPLLVAPLAALHLFAQLPGLPFILAVVMAASIGRLAVGILATAESVVLLEGFVLNRQRLLDPHPSSELAAVLLFIVVALLVARFTARLERERADARRERLRLKLLIEAGDTLGSSLDYETTIRELGHYLVPTFADWCSVDLMEEPGVIENLVVAHRDASRVVEAREILRRYPPSPDDAGGVPHVVRTGEAQVVPEITDQMLEAGIPDRDRLDAIRSLGLRSAMLVPLTANGRTFGAITFASGESGIRYTERDLPFAREIAHRAALAIANARAYQAEADAKASAEEAADRNAILQGVTAAFGRARTRTEVAQAVLNQGLTAAGATAGVVGLLESGGQIHIVAITGYERDDRSYWQHFGLDDHYPLSDAIRQMQPVILRTVKERDERYPALTGTGEKEDHPLVCIPFMLGGSAIGGISASFPPGSTFDAERLAFLTAVADQAAQAIDRANVYDREQEARDQLDRLAKVSQALAASLEFGTTVERVLELAVAHLAPEAVLYLLEGPSPTPAGRARRDPEKGPVVEACEPGWTVAGMRGEDLARRAIASGREEMIEGEHDAIIVLPLSIAGHTHGVLILSGVEPPGGPTESALMLPREAARRMARALENSAAYRDRDHVARTLQNSLLPPALPDIPHLQVEAIFRPALSAYEIGGDFYDIFQTRTGSWAAVIGDVCGKGIEAAALTSLARYTLRAVVSGKPPSQALGELNGALLQQELDGKFCTVCLVEIEPTAEGADLVVSSAGHPLPQLVRADGSNESIGRHGTLLGVTRDVQLVDVRCRLEPGESLVLYTDGLLDRSTQHLDEASQLRQALEVGADPRSTVKARIEGYISTLTAEQQDDDVAVLLLGSRRA